MRYNGVGYEVGLVFKEVIGIFGISNVFDDGGYWKFFFIEYRVLFLRFLGWICFVRGIFLDLRVFFFFLEIVGRVGYKRLVLCIRWLLVNLYVVKKKIKVVNFIIVKREGYFKR